MFVAAFRLLNSSLTNLSRLFHCLIFKVLNFCRSLRQLYNFINYFPSCQELFLFSFAPSFTERYTSYHVWTSLSIHFLMFFVAHQAVSLFILSSISRCVNHIFYNFLSFLFLSFIATIYSAFNFPCHNFFYFKWNKSVQSTFSHFNRRICTAFVPRASSAVRLFSSLRAVHYCTKCFILSWKI